VTTDPTIDLHDIDAALAAATAGLPHDAAELIVQSWPAVFRDKRQAIVGFGG